MGSASSPQSGEPFLRVCADGCGGAVWEVVGMGYVVRTYSGQRALNILEKMLQSKGQSDFM